MCCLDIVWVIVSPRPSHSFGISMVWHDVVVVRKLFVADGAFAVLLDDLPVQQFPHFRGGPEFPISPRVISVVNSLDAEQ